MLPWTSCGPAPRSLAPPISRASAPCWDRCGARPRTPRVLHALHAGLAAVLEGHQQVAAMQAASNAVVSVLMHPHLFPSLLEWLVNDARSVNSRRHLSTMALVCKQWKEVARQDKFWQGMTEGLFPTGEEGAGGAHGRCLVETPLVRSEHFILTDVNDIQDPDEETRWLHIDISDTRDGYVYYRNCGALVVVGNGGTTWRFAPMEL